MLQGIKWIGMAECVLHEYSDVPAVNFWTCLCHRVYSYEKNDSVSERGVCVCVIHHDTSTSTCSSCMIWLLCVSLSQYIVAGNSLQ